MFPASLWRRVCYNCCLFCYNSTFFCYDSGLRRGLCVLWVNPFFCYNRVGFATLVLLWKQNWDFRGNRFYGVLLRKQNCFYGATMNVSQLILGGRGAARRRRRLRHGRLALFSTSLGSFRRGVRNYPFEHVSQGGGGGSTPRIYWIYDVNTICADTAD